MRARKAGLPGLKEVEASLSRLVKSPAPAPARKRIRRAAPSLEGVHHLAGPDELDIELSRAHAALDSGDCAEAYEATLTAAAMVGAEGGSEAKGKLVRQVAKKFVGACVRRKP